MRKLLEEAAKCFDNFRDVFNRLGQVSSSDSCIYMRDKITAALSEPEPDAMEIALRVLSIALEIDIETIKVLYSEESFSNMSEAAALIADHKRVPRAMLDDLYSIAFGTGQGSNLMLPEEAKSRILAKYGYRAE